MPQPWADRAACKDDRALMTPAVLTAEAIAAAQSVCERCPVQAECLIYAMTHRVPPGVWGGVPVSATSADVAALVAPQTQRTGTGRRGPRANSQRPYRGVSRTRSGRWQAIITVRHKRRWLGTYGTPEEAARAYDAAAAGAWGHFAPRNQERL